MKKHILAQAPQLLPQRKKLHSRCFKLVRYLKLKRFDRDFESGWFDENFYRFICDLLIDPRLKANFTSLNDDLVLLYLGIGLLVRARMPEGEMETFLSEAVHICSQESSVRRYKKRLGSPP